jgi:PIN domain nuclease of toxin-antitoxin system
VKVLLDTHAFLWAVRGHGLGATAHRVFLDPKNTLFLSAASFWEICIKASLGKLKLAPSWSQQFEQEMLTNQIQWLPIQKDHCQQLMTLPLFHRDPFDRLLIAQAQVEGMTLLTTDGNIQQYAVATLW